LHNIAIQWRFPETDLYYDEIDQELPGINENAAIENGNEVREQIINTYF